MRKTYLGTLYYGVSDNFQRGLYRIARCLKGEKHDLAVVEMIKLGVDMKNDRDTITKQASKQASKQVKIAGSLDSKFESTNRVYLSDGCSPTICTYCGGNQEAKILEAQSLRMVRTDEGKALRKAYESGEIHHGFNEYRLAEPRTDGISNTVTTVQKDNLILEIKKDIDQKFHDFIYEIDGEFYMIRIRKLTPIECWRLMDFSDADYEKAENVNSQTQLYKEAGNSIVKVVLMAIMSQLGIEGVKKWNDISIEERSGLNGKI